MSSATRTVLIASGAAAATYAASFWAWHVPVIGVISWIVLVVLAFNLTLVRPDLALGLLMAELVLGGKGYLFALTFGNVNVSLRLGLFLAVFIGWLVHVIRGGTFWGSQWRFRWVWVGLVGAVAWAVLVGLLRGHSLGAVYGDANAFLFLGLAPVFGLLKSRSQFLRIVTIMVGALVGLAALTALVQGLFTHVLVDHLSTLYRWIRDDGLGEVTHILNQSYRVFFQSHVYGLVLFFTSIGLAVSQRRWSWAWAGSAVLAAYVVIVSLSRSFWLGAGASTAVAIVLLLWNRRARQYFSRVIFTAAATAVLAFAGYLWTVNFPFLTGHGNVIQSRSDITLESAASSRRELLPVLNRAILQHPLTGSGWGTALTYRTHDPRVNVTGDPAGTAYTSTAFELGYHAFALQFGIPVFLGVLALLLWFMRQGGMVLRLEGVDRPLLAGLWLGLVSIFVLHLTTPYLNHPLGLGVLLLVAAATSLYDPRYAQH